MANARRVGLRWRSFGLGWGIRGELIGIKHILSRGSHTNSNSIEICRYFQKAVDISEIMQYTVISEFASGISKEM